MIKIKNAEKKILFNETIQKKMFNIMRTDIETILGFLIIAATYLFRVKIVMPMILFDGLIDMMFSIGAYVGARIFWHYNRGRVFGLLNRIKKKFNF